ncbi:Transitional endoplasmic reticulum ATPase [Seminavis robusta]|uniref:Transitional endoplasmic reticulum ATPase n=1 Tax=Seminavis robusta TaxID=568900 RepID=A0A9N8DX73_9STRA|nr:Transitional endoplasmic reticulum ATPase [Seminavis robusta]|eukprot:Sro349_g123430.1 Transitional endoplasmic reticulum ATPase (1151) ;mRNA; r:26238-29793
MTTTPSSTTSDSLGPNARLLQESCPALLSLLSANGKELLAVLDMETASDGSSPNVSPLPTTEIPWYWHQVHLMLVLRVLVTRTSSGLATAVVESNYNDSRTGGALPFPDATPAQLSERLTLLQSLLQKMQDKLEQWEQQEQQIVDDNKKKAPLQATMGLLAKAYQMKPVEKRIFQFLVTTKTQPSPTVLALVTPHNGELPTKGEDDDMAFRSTMLRYVCGVTVMYWGTLANEDHDLCKDRILVLTQEEYGNDKMLSVSEEVCRVLFGWPLKSEDKIKLSGTKLLKLMQPDAADGFMMEDGDEATDDAGSTDEDAEDTMAFLGRLSLRGDDDMVKELAKLEREVTKSADTLPSLPGLEEGSPQEEEETTPSEKGAATTATTDTATTDDDNDDDSTGSSEDKTKPQPYKNELEYLQQYFEIVMYKVVYSRQRVQQEIRNASLGDTKPSWMRSSAENSNSKFSVGEMSAKIRMGRRKMQLSLELTRKSGKFYPRLEILAKQLQLDDFHKFCLVYLAGAMISPIFKSCIQGEEYSPKNAKVGDILVVYFDSFAEQVANRTYFYRSSKLLRKGLIKFIETYQLNDLTDQELKLDRRVLDCIVGLDKESSEISTGSHLYEPKVSLDAVVLPGPLKDTITKAVSHFEQFRTYRKHHPDFDDAIAYGVGLTLMFCGKSGTGKTMTANAIAARLGKKLLLVNFPLLNKKSENKEGETSKYQSIFREAELSDAIIFFDECESLFSQRGFGGSSETTELLTELERFEGIVFLATNRPFDLDEAMYRRISEVFEFKPPNYLERLDIWKLVTSHDAVPCDPNIDWESIALKYELTGGFIKNAVISALLDAVGRDPRSPCVKEEDILEGCKKQVRGALQMVDFNERVVPRGGISDLVVADSVMEKVHEIVNLEKARAILFGNWGFDADMRSRQGTTSLFWGPSGTGRSRAAEAIGFELGKPLKVLDLPRLLSERKGNESPGDGSAKSVRAVFHEARLMDAVLVLDGFSLDTDGGGGGGGADSHVLNLVMREMTRFPGVVIMMVTASGSLDVFVSRLDKSLVKSLKFLVEFQLPSTSNREILWKKLMPPALPLSEDLNYRKLAEASSDFSVSHIGNAVYRAAATAALRKDAKDRSVSMKALYAAIEEEKTRGESAVDRWVKAQYI